MDNNQLDHVNRADKKLNFIQAHSSELTATPEIVQTLAPQLEAAITKTREDDAIATRDDTGIAENKSETRLALEDEVFHIASGLASIADDANDAITLNLVEFPLSTIQGFRQGRLIEFAQMIYKKAAVPATAQLLASKHNTTAADIAQLKTLTDTYIGELSDPNVAKAERVAYGKQVDRDLEAIQKIENKIDRKMNTYRKTNRLLFDTYDALKELDVTKGHSGSTSLTGSVLPGETKFTGLPITYTATASITLANKGTVALTFQFYTDNSPVGTGLEVQGGTSLTTTFNKIGDAGNKLFVINKEADVSGNWSVSI